CGDMPIGRKAFASIGVDSGKLRAGYMIGILNECVSTPQNHFFNAFSSSQNLTRLLLPRIMAEYFYLLFAHKVDLCLAPCLRRHTL
ncbi:hypothetical protein ACFQ3H_11760, partial [Paralysiella testudinis]|uniref:hypothetical protein n=1 Tax=Paralysiella testudinis TaxID=2809020 RepID=UPI00363103ED